MVVLPDGRTPDLGAGAVAWVVVLPAGVSVLRRPLPLAGSGEEFRGESRQHAPEEAAEEGLQGGATRSRSGQRTGESIEAISVHKGTYSRCAAVDRSCSLSAARFPHLYPQKYGGDRTLDTPECPVAVVCSDARAVLSHQAAVFRLDDGGRLDEDDFDLVSGNVLSLTL
jgi:hypothetical protein